MRRRLEECRSCKASVFWARTAFNHTPIPIDWEPADNGNILILETDVLRFIAVVLPPGDERIAAETTYTTHFTTCPDGDRWRKRNP